MPPTPSCFSTNLKETHTGKTNENAIPNTTKEEEFEALVDEFLATPLGQMVRPTVELVKAEAAAKKSAPSNPDNPPCDGCKKPYAGTMHCCQCKSVFYCGKDCQVGHWNVQHKTDCKRLKKHNKETARRILRDFVEVQDWTALDVAGAYKAAVNQGLLDKIREVMELDKAEKIIERYRNGRGIGRVLTSNTQCVMSTLFRWQRAEGNAAAKSASFDRVDGRRIRDYVRSHPAALNTWLQASIQWIRVSTNLASRMSDPYLVFATIEAANEVWSGWSLVFASSTATRAILSPFPSDDGGSDASTEKRLKRGIDHVRGVVNTLGEALRLVQGAQGSYVNPRSRLESEIESSLSTLEASVSEVAAFVLLRTQEHRIAIDVEKVLKLKETTKFLFETLEILMAKKKIANGGSISAQELLAVMALETRNLVFR